MPEPAGLETASDAPFPERLLFPWYFALVIRNRSLAWVKMKAENGTNAGLHIACVPIWLPIGMIFVVLALACETVDHGRPTPVAAP